MEKPTIMKFSTELLTAGLFLITSPSQAGFGDLLNKVQDKIHQANSAVGNQGSTSYSSPARGSDYGAGLGSNAKIMSDNQYPIAQNKYPSLAPMTFGKISQCPTTGKLTKAQAKCLSGAYLGYHVGSSDEPTTTCAAYIFPDGRVEVDTISERKGKNHSGSSKAPIRGTININQSDMNFSRFSANNLDFSLNNERNPITYFNIELRETEGVMNGRFIAHDQNGEGDCTLKIK